MIFGLLILASIVAGVSLVAATITAVIRIATKSDTLAITIGTLAIPVLLCASFGYWLLTMEADGAPPGNVLMGNLTALAMLTPIALLASRLTVKFLSRRAPLNTR
jgi:hypothetical protein